MKLYATGFNAWNQLRFETAAGDEGSLPHEQKDEDPKDIHSFACILQDEHIQHVRNFTLFTAASTSRGQRVTTGVPETSRGDHYNYAEALNGQVAAYDTAGTIHQYLSVEDFCRQSSSKETFSVFQDIVQLISYEAGFAALTASGQVWTWGDGRYPACLGREVTDESPADKPGRVSCLEDLPTGPIVKIAAGGYVLAALTRGRDLYCWGGYPGRKPVLESLTGDPAPIVVVLEGSDPNLDMNVDIADIGIGESHMIMLTAEGDICVIGSNTNGQLGMDPKSRPAVTSSWAKASLEVADNEHVAGIAAGPRSSFVLVDKKT